MPFAEANQQARWQQAAQNLARTRLAAFAPLSDAAPGLSNSSAQTNFHSLARAAETSRISNPIAESHLTAALDTGSAPNSKRDRSNVDQPDGVQDG